MPVEASWYLGVLATDPDRQRQGLASAAIAPVLERADHDRVTTYLETGAPENLGLLWPPPTSRSPTTWSCPTVPPCGVFNAPPWISDRLGSKERGTPAGGIGRTEER